MSFNRLLDTKVKEIEVILENHLPTDMSFQKTVGEAMNYSVRAGGKRIRPMLMQEIFIANGGKSKALESFMTAIECIHTYSLVHDDLPAMDDDDYRRGVLTTHKKYGEAMGVLAGDALLNYAFELVAGAFGLVPESEYIKVVKAFEILSRKAGVFGMIGGQVCDVEAEKAQVVLDKDQILYIHEHKTAALIQASMMIGGVLAGCDDAYIDKLERAAYDIGIAFQIQDDVLDITSTFEELGKPIGSDEKNNKQTYVSIYGLDHAKSEVERLSDEAIFLLGVSEDDFLCQLILYLIDRNK
ncbi:MAG: farnesyl diphosphate synthase [Lachnospiraceae bacterium]